MAAAVSTLNPNAPAFSPPTSSLVRYVAPPPLPALPTYEFSCSSYPPPPPPPPPYGQEMVGCCAFSGGGYTSTCCLCPPCMGYPLPPPLPQLMLTPPPAPVYHCAASPAIQPPAAPRSRPSEIVEGGIKGSARAAVGGKQRAGGKPIERTPAPCRRGGVNAARHLPPRRAALLPPPPPPPAPPVARMTATSARGRRDFGDHKFDPLTRKTSVMIRNIPNKFTKKRMMAILDQHCVEANANLATDGGSGGACDGESEHAKSEYDFLYLPIDFRTRSNKGYAFVNLTTAEAACRLHDFLDGHRWDSHNSRKTCAVTHARIQGLQGLVEHFSKSRFRCDTDEYLPVRFQPPRDGVRRPEEHVVGERTLR